MKAIYSSMLVAIFSLPFFLINSVAYSYSIACDIIDTDVLSETPLEIIEMAGSLIVYNTRLSAYTYLTSELPLFVPPDIDMHYRSGLVKLSPSGSYVFTPYLNESRNLLLHFAELSDSEEVRFTVSDPDWQGNELGIPYWLKSSTVIVPIRLGSNKYKFDLIQPKNHLTHITVEFDNGIPSPRRFPILSPDSSRIVYVGLDNSHDSLIIFDVAKEVVAFETAFNQIDSVGLIQWSPSGHHLAFQYMNTDSNTNSISIITKNGDELFSIEDGILSPYTIADSDLFQWSPEGTNILYLSQDDEQSWSQVLVNVETKKQTRICIPGEAFFSSDGNYIVLTVFDQSGGTGSMLTDIYVYDVLNEQIYRTNIPNLSDVGSVLGWSTIK